MSPTDHTVPELMAQACALFGFSYQSDAVQQFLSNMPPHKAEKPSDGAQYIVCKAGGLDLLFADPHVGGRGNKQDRRLVAIFLYNAGADQHEMFAGPLPFGFEFGDQRETLLKKQTPLLTWKIGEGRVPVTEPFPSSDTWEFGDFELSASYYSEDSEKKGIHHFQLHPKTERDETKEWKAPDTWQKLALDPQRKREAMQLYRQENGGGIAEAKAAVEAFISQNS